MQTAIVHKFKPYVFPDLCVCGGKLHIRMSQIHPRKIVMLCESLACKRIGYGESVPDAINNYEQVVKRLTEQL